MWCAAIRICSHKVTYSSSNLSHIKNYDGTLRINTTDRGRITITAISNLSFLTSTSCVSVSTIIYKSIVCWKIVDNDRSVLFSHSSCVVLDKRQGRY